MTGFEPVFTRFQQSRNNRYTTSPLYPLLPYLIISNTKKRTKRKTKIKYLNFMSQIHSIVNKAQKPSYYYL